MIFDALGRLALGEVEVEAAEAAAAPEGWQGLRNTAVRRASVIALVGGLVFVPAPPAAPAATGAWQQPLSNAPARRNAPQPELRPFGVTVAAVVTAPEGWQQPPSRAAPRPPVGPGGPTYTFLSTAFTQNTVDISKWQQPLGKAAARPPVWQGNAFVPFDTAQIIQNTVDYSIYQQPLSRAVPIPRAALGSTFVPLNTAQVVVADFYGWWQPASRAPDRRPLIQPELKPFGVQLYAAVAPPDGWHVPLSEPLDRQPVHVGATFVPLNTAQVVVGDVYGWWQPLAGAPKRRGQAGQQRAAIAFPLPDDQNVRWWRQLDRAASIPRAAPQGFTAVPFNTVQVVAADVYGWWQPASVAPPPRPLIHPDLRPFGVTESVAVAAVYGWWQPLSRATEIPRGPVGFTVVPFDTAQRVAVDYGWQQPLSKAAAKPPVWQGGATYTFLSTQFTQNTVSWGNYQQPLSRPATHPPVWQGASVVPFDTAQVIFNTIDYSLYMQPLSRAVPIPYTTFTVGYVFVPWDTTQVIPPPRPGGVQPPGFWYEEWERIADRQRKRKKPAPEILVAVDELPPDWEPSKTFKVSPAVIEALAQAQSIDDIRELARQETGQVRNMLNMLIAEYKRRVKDEDDIEIILMTMH